MAGKGSAPGEHRGGRKPGIPNRASQKVSEILARLKCDPAKGMALIASGDVPCGTCHGKGKNKVKGTDGVMYERTCESCYGTLKEKVTPDTRLRAYTDLAKFCYPQLKAIEHSGEINTSSTIEQRLIAGRKRIATPCPRVDNTPIPYHR